MNHKVIIFGVALLCTALAGEALTLGRVRGAVLVGQPLNMVVPVQMEAGEDASTLCFEADVFHADTRQDARRVRVVVEPTGQANAANVRVISSAVIDEPVVTVYLRTGCGQKTTRRYVLLADVQSEVSAPPLTSRVAPVAALSLAPAALTPVPPVLASASSLATRSAQAVKPKAGRAPRPAVRPEADRKRPEVKEAVAKTRPSQSRLKLDPLDVLSDRISDLDSSMTFAPPEDALRNMQKMQTLEGNVKALLALAAKNEASLLDLKTRLYKAESDRFPASVIYGLIALVLACVAALASLWNRQRRVQAGDNDWWSGSLATPDAAPPEPPSGSLPGALVAEPEPAQAVVTPQAPVAAVSNLSSHPDSLTESGYHLKEMSESDFDHLMEAESTPSVKLKPPTLPLPAPVAMPHKGAVSSLNSEAVQDIRQQAEFFVSLGQTDRAVRILKKQIDETDEPNPFFYLDLLSLFHSLSMKVDFQLFREDFNQLFKGRVPDFSSFKDEGQDLVSYPEVLSRITALWPMPGVLDVIEECIFQYPHGAQTPSFDLTAFRDLLFLHEIALSVVLSAAPAELESKAGATDRGRQARGLPRALDLDLSDAQADEEGPITMGDLIKFDLPVVAVQQATPTKKPT